jgi:hypothetical protein
MRRYAYAGALFLLLSFGAAAQEPAPGSDPAMTSASEGAPDRATPQPAPGYIITPWGSLIFPDAPPPTGDTSTFSGAGPSVSTGPEVGLGPRVGLGPKVGTGPVVGTAP